MTKIMDQFSPKIFSGSLWIFQSQIESYFKSRASIYGTISVTFIIAIIFSIVIKTDSCLVDAQMQEFKFLSLIIAILCSSILSSDAMVERDIQSSFFEGLYITGIPLSMIIIVRYLAHNVVYSLLYVIMTPVVMLTLSMDITLHSIIIVICLIFYINLLLLFSSSLSVGMKSQLLSHIICLPLMIPAIIFATMHFRWEYALWLLLASYCLIFPWIIIATRYMVKLSFENVSNS